MRTWSLMLCLTVGTVALAAGARATDDHDHEAAQSRSEHLLEGARRLAARDAYLRYCASCHGKDGRSAHADFTSPEATVRLSRQSMIAATRHGHPDAVGNAWTGALAPEQIEAVVDYVREALMLPAPVADASIGRSIYARTCSVCHGERGNAMSWARDSLNPPPFDFTSRTTGQISRRTMVNSVTYGVPGTAMMPFTTQLSQEEVAAVVDYIRATFLRPEAPSGSVATARMPRHDDHHGAGEDFGPDAPFPGGLIGSYERGEALYRQNCAECHGEAGDGNGRRAYFMLRKPRDFTSEKAGVELNRPHLFEAVAKGVRRTEMSAWSKVLDAGQIADVAEYVLQAFIRADTAAPRWQPHAEHDDGKKKH